MINSLAVSRAFTGALEHQINVSAPTSLEDGTSDRYDRSISREIYDDYSRLNIEVLKRLGFDLDVSQSKLLKKLTTYLVLQYYAIEKGNVDIFKLESGNRVNFSGDSLDLTDKIKLKSFDLMEPFYLDHLSNLLGFKSLHFSKENNAIYEFETSVKFPKIVKDIFKTHTSSSTSLGSSSSTPFLVYVIDNLIELNKLTISNETEIVLLTGSLIDILDYTFLSRSKLMIKRIYQYKSSYLTVLTPTLTPTSSVDIDKSKFRYDHLSSYLYLNKLERGTLSSLEMPDDYKYVKSNMSNLELVLNWNNFIVDTNSSFKFTPETLLWLETNLGTAPPLTTLLDGSQLAESYQHFFRNLIRLDSGDLKDYLKVQNEFALPADWLESNDWIPILKHMLITDVDVVSDIEGGLTRKTVAYSLNKHLGEYYALDYHWTSIGAYFKNCIEWLSSGSSSKALPKFKTLWMGRELPLEIAFLTTLMSGHHFFYYEERESNLEFLIERYGSYLTRHNVILPDVQKPPVKLSLKSKDSYIVSFGPERWPLDLDVEVDSQSRSGSLSNAKQFYDLVTLYQPSVKLAELAWSHLDRYGFLIYITPPLLEQQSSLNSEALTLSLVDREVLDYLMRRPDSTVISNFRHEFYGLKATRHGCYVFQRRG